ncbi:hypothetical protein Rhopal_003537-T1 [Rhodotorula paludigena]|uniref:Uncharacterized protein n=1 Tax=Rhodotorula paludigena TaxID=86838 RepID=A0AAV5GDB0_9BASI|nr:hypothetical protein Rhopal_003537-T1 [Rhodotorula paludigena]
MPLRDYFGMRLITRTKRLMPDGRVRYQTRVTVLPPAVALSPLACLGLAHWSLVRRIDSIRGSLAHEFDSINAKLDALIRLDGGRHTRTSRESPATVFCHRVKADTGNEGKAVARRQKEDRGESGSKKKGSAGTA